MEYYRTQKREHATTRVMTSMTLKVMVMEDMLMTLILIKYSKPSSAKEEEEEVHSTLRLVDKAVCQEGFLSNLVKITFVLYIQFRFTVLIQVYTKMI